jgi:hypothetical protein
VNVGPQTVLRATKKARDRGRKLLRLFQRWQVPATCDDLESRADDIPVEHVRHRQRRDGVVLAPQDQRGSSQAGELPVELFPRIGEGFEHAADRGPVAPLEMEGIGEIDERLAHHGLVVDARGIGQDDSVHLLRESQGECGDDPAAERMAEEMGACDSDVGEESLEHFDVPGDSVIDQRLVRAPEAEEIECNDAMRRGERIETEGPLVGVPPTPWTRTSGRPSPMS